MVSVSNGDTHRLARHCVALLAVLLAGCDSYFLWQVDVDAHTDGGVTILTSADEAAVIAEIEAYSAANGLECEKASSLPIRCARTPIRIVAFKTAGGATVCYGALGIPFEGRKYYERTQDLKRALVARFGESRVFSDTMTSSWSERCARGVRAG
jgi:hypothetical protein